MIWRYIYYNNNNNIYIVIMYITRYFITKFRSELKIITDIINLS